MSRLVRLCLIAAAMSVFLSGMLGLHLGRRANGAEILVPVEGYDPRDVFLGHFSAIRTPLHQLDAHTLDGDDEFERGDAIFVRLEAGSDGSARPVSLHRDHPGGDLVAQGRVGNVSAIEETAWTDTTDPDTGEIRSERRVVDDKYRIWIRYNIERYYASERAALALERRLLERGADGQTGVRLILSSPPDGALLIKGLEIDGERWIDTVWRSRTPFGEDREEERRQ